MRRMWSCWCSSWDGLRVVGLVLGMVVGGCVSVPCGALGAPNAKHPFAIEPGSFSVVASTYQAGAHADLTTSFNFNHAATEEEKTFNDVKTTVINLPAGFVGNSTAVPTCSDAQLSGGSTGGSECPPESQVGVIQVSLTADHKAPDRFTSPVYNMQSNTGVAATLGFNIGNGIITQILPVSVRPSDIGITVTSPSIEDEGEPHAVVTTVWGVPASPVHDALRGLQVEVFNPGKPNQEERVVSAGGEVVHIPQRAFLSNPTSCTGRPLVASMSSDSWEEPFIEEPERWSHATSEMGPITGCERIPFDPTFEALPTTTDAESPSGLDATVSVPQTYEDPESLATSDLMSSKVVLPEGITVNPSAGAGLGACSPEELERETAFSQPGEGCPPQSKIGTVEIETPLLAEKLAGAVYVATPYDNPFSEEGHPEEGHPGGSLLAIYVVARDAARGVVVKVAGKIERNPVTGQLTTTFLETPQAPFNRFILKFRPGATAPLVSPPACGSYTAQSEMTPWSAPLEPRLASTPPFTITAGVRGGACPSGGVPPLHPEVVAYPVHPNAGAYSPFYLRISRQDGEQEITGFSTTMPPGLSGKLTGVEKCPDADIEAARRQTGAQAEASPACPKGSEIGSTLVEAGVGTVLAQTPGRVFLAGPYHGAPLSIVSVTSAKVGPFDLGAVVIRFALDINPTTAQVEVSAKGSDPIPHILDGIVVHVRNIRVHLDRENFTLNPTSCTPGSIVQAITGGGSEPQNPAAWQPVTVTTPFQVADCANLAFKPTFTVSTKGKTSRAEGASLTTTVTYPPASIGTQANVAGVKVELPKALPSRLTTLQKACTSAQFTANPAGCPPASIVGHAVVHTPVIPEALQGPAYFVSHGGEAFPNLDIVLQGYGLTIELIGDTFIQNGITSSTFKATPDVPFETFQLTLPQSPHSALAATGNLCQQNLIMPTQLTAQNGDTIHQSTHIEVEGCPDTLTVTAKHTHGRTLTLHVVVPAAGTLRATAHGLRTATKRTARRELLTLKLTARRAHHLRTHVHLTFTPTTGPRKKLTKTVGATFR